MSTQKFVAKYANWLLRNRWPTVIVSIAVLAILASFLGRMSFDSNYRIWFDEHDPYLQSYDRFVKEFGHDDMFVVAFEDPNGILNPKPAETLQRLTEQLWQVTGVIRVDSLANFQALRGTEEGFETEALFPAKQEITEARLQAAKDYIKTDSLVAGALLSPDQKVGILRGRIAPVAVTPELPAKVYAQLNQILAAEQARSGYRFYIAGGPITDQAFDQVAQSDMAFLVPLLLVILGAVWFAVFRSFLGVTVALAISLLSVVGAMGITALAGHKLNIVTASTPQLLIGIAVASSLHVMAIFVSAKRRGLNSADAVRETLQSNMGPVLLTSITTSIGFFSFYFTANIIPLKRLGFSAGFGTLLILLMTLILMPALLSFFPEKTPRPVFDSPWFKSLLDKVRKLCQQHPRRVILGWTVFISVFIAFIPKVTVDSNPVSYFKSNFWFSESVHFLEDKGSGGAVYELVVRGNGHDSVKTKDYVNDLDALTNYLSNQAPGGFSNVSSLSVILKNINRALHQGDQAWHILPQENNQIAQYLFLYGLSVPVGQDLNDRINLDSSATRVTVIRKLVPTRISRLNMDTISTWAQQNLKHVQVEFTGRDVLYTNMGNYVADNLIQSFAWSVLMVTVMIGFIYRSWTLGLVSTLPNILPLAVALGIMGMTGIYLDIGTIMVASIGYGIAVDDSIHFFSHYWSARKSGHNARDAVTETFSEVGISITFTTVVLTLSFSVFLLGDFMPNFYKGLLLSVFLLVALGANLSITPAVLCLIDKIRVAKVSKSALKTPIAETAHEKN